MANRRGGGSAFPVATARDSGPQSITDIAEGLTMRDWFAAQGDAPTHAEIVAAVNVTVVYSADDDMVTVGANPAVSFAAWWAGLTQNKRARALAEVRYQHADAMLLVRDL